MFPSLQRLVRHCLPALRLFAYIAPLALVCFYSYQVVTPGPFVHYNVFTGLILSLCLLFTSSQLVLLDKGATTYTGGRWRRRLTKFYWSGVAGTAIACGICYAVVHKYDCMAICIFILLVSIFASVRLAELTRQDCERRCVNRRRSGVYQLVNDTISKLKLPQTPQTPQMRVDSFDTQWRPSASPAKASSQFPEPARWEQDDEIPWWKSANKFWKAGTWTSRPFRVLHILISIFNVLGAVTLVQRSRYDNPGQRMVIEVPPFGKQSVNFYCTIGSVPDPGSKPTIWLEGNSTQGVADFQGIQHYLLDYNISSCSYDPPSFGGSDSLPSTANTDRDLQSWMPAIVKALESSLIYSDLNAWHNFTYVGWGSGGLKLAVQHALANNESSKIIALDPAPDGIEYYIEQVAHKLTETQRLDLRRDVLGRQADSKRNTLAFGLVWGLLPFFKEARIPTPSTFWPPSGVAVWKAQKQQETILARQYYDLRRAAASRREGIYLKKTKLREEMELHAIVNQNDVPGDVSSNDLWRRQRLSVVKSLGGRPTPTTWCWEDCSAMWPIEKAEFAAQVIARIVNG